jgi:hypothetical protein
MECCQKIETILEKIHKQLTLYQKLELTRAFHYFMKDLDIQNSELTHLKELNALEEETLMKKVSYFLFNGMKYS